jgi:hypothetical protein
MKDSLRIDVTVPPMKIQANLIDCISSQNVPYLSRFNKKCPLLNCAVGSAARAGFRLAPRPHTNHQSKIFLAEAFVPAFFRKHESLLTLLSMQKKSEL